MEKLSTVQYLKEKLYWSFYKQWFTKMNRDVKRIVKKGYKQSFKDPLVADDSHTDDYPVDFVVTWVDGNDPVWQKEKQSFEMPERIHARDNTAARYRNWDNLQYWFRAVEDNAPWVRYIFLVTYGHLPTWIDRSNPKLKIINHRDYIPSRFLPTYNSRAIELNLWRIPELSEHFVYFNDDVFLVNSVWKNDFFVRGLPRITAIATPIRPARKMDSFNYALFNNIGLINSSFKIREVIKEHPEKWFSHIYEEGVRQNVRVLENGYLSGMIYPHMCFPFRKSSMAQCAESFASAFELTGSHRFRTKEDVNPQIFHLWEMMNNSFCPTRHGYFGKYENLSSSSPEILEGIILSSSFKCVCANDVNQIDDSNFDYVSTRLREILQEKYPNQSSFEI